MRLEDLFLERHHLPVLRQHADVTDVMVFNVDMTPHRSSLCYSLMLTPWKILSHRIPYAGYFFMLL